MVLTAAALAVVAAVATVVAVAAPGDGAPRLDAGQVTSAFLRAWQDGNLALAARYTDDPATAQAALRAYRADLHLTRLTVAAGAVTAVTGTRKRVTLAVSATVSASLPAPASAGVPGASGGTTVTGTWRYHSSLTVYRRGGAGGWLITWAPADLAPNLTAGTHLAAVAVPPQVLAVTDSGGKDLTGYGDAGLTTIAGLLAKRGPRGGQGGTGLLVEIQTAAGVAVPDSAAAVLAPGAVPALKTTISAKAETAARAAVAAHKGSSMVAIQPSTGKILAIANNDGYNDFALTADVAPGSTGKIVSATALLAAGVVTANTDVSCPAAYTVQGVTYHNDSGESEPASTPLTGDFAQSCNNAFAQWWPRLTGGRLAAAAREYYGLNEPWDIGLGQAATYYRTPPGASGSEVAMEAFGEGGISAAPLAIASVAATVDTGTFRQPILVPGTRQRPATPLPAGTDAGLKQMMRAVVTSGTAAGLGFGPDVYAKTGTADITGQEQPNSWFVAFDSRADVAVACLVLNAGYGAQYAAPAARTFLSRY